MSEWDKEGKRCDGKEIERRATDSPLFQLTEDPWGAGHALRVNQTVFSWVFLWTVAVYECVGSLWTSMRGRPPPPSHWLPPDHREDSWSAVPLDTVPADRGQIWAHMVPIESANKRQTGAMTQCDPPPHHPLASQSPSVADSQPSASI